MFDATISLGAVMAIIGNVVITAIMGTGFIWTIKSAVAVLNERLRLQNDSHVLAITDINQTITEIREETKKLSTVVTDLALQHQRQNFMEARIERLEARVNS